MTATTHRRPSQVVKQTPAPVLTDVAYRVRLIGLLSEVQLTQVYRNDEQVPVEAVFTFPAPVAAVILSLTVELGDRRLHSQVLPREQAKEGYEDAVVDGDAAVMVESAAPGLYTVNCGNLLPGETARVQLRWAELLQAQGQHLRYWLPTTVAPRYGDPAAAGLAAHQVPAVSLAVERLCRIEVEVTGLWADGAIASPTHGVVVERQEALTRVVLAVGPAPMDRDFVLNLEAATLDRACAWLEHDGVGPTVWAAFHPEWEEAGGRPPRCVQLVVDCSGSMAGDSIEQARQALFGILRQLRPQDWFNVVRFGTCVSLLFDRPQPADGEALAQAWALVRGLQADMGGTEIGRALDQAYAAGRLQFRGGDPMAPVPSTTDVLLITDGEVWQAEPVMARARRSGCRVFTVGVGSAVAEAFLRQLGNETGGTCELVAPGEGMAERIVRHFSRIWDHPARGVGLSWPGPAVGSDALEVGPVYPRQALHVMTRLQAVTGAQVKLTLDLADGTACHWVAPVQPVPWAAESLGVLARLAAARLLLTGALDAQAATALAVEHQLLSPHTAMLVVAQRAESEKDGRLPSLRAVAHMQAAGWGGLGSVRGAVPACAVPSAPPMLAFHDAPCAMADHACFDLPANRRHRRSYSNVFDAAGDRSVDALRASEAYPTNGDAWRQYRAERLHGGPPAVPAMTDDQLCRLCSYLGQHDLPPSLTHLQAAGAPAYLVAQLAAWVDDQHPEAGIVALFLHQLAQRLRPELLDLQVCRRLRLAARQARRTGDCSQVEQRIRQLLGRAEPPVASQGTSAGGGLL